MKISIRPKLISYNLAVNQFNILLIFSCMTVGSSNLRVIPPVAWEPGGCSWPVFATNGEVY